MSFDNESVQNDQSIVQNMNMQNNHAEEGNHSFNNDE